MKRIHRTVWGKARSALIAVSEVTASQGKGKGAQGGSGSAGGAGPHGPSELSRSLTALCQGLLLAGLGAMGQMAHGLPQSGQVGSSSATVVQTGQNAPLNWRSYQVRFTWSERVALQQPDTSAIAFTRISDPSASQIPGSLSANGQVFLVNPNGIVFGARAQVSVGALVASTLGLRDSALAQASKTFSGAGTGSVTNLGAIQAASGSFVALIANQVSNQGSIQAPGGTVALGAGAQVILQFADNQLLGLTVDRNTLDNLADNQQLIQTDGGQVILSAGARDSVLAGVINNSGRMQARTLQDLGGGIKLVGGQVQQLGTLDVSALTSGNARRVRVDAASVLDGGHIDASSAGDHGGQVSLNAAGGLIQTAQAVVNADGATQGGHVVLQGHNTFTSATLGAQSDSVEAHGSTIDMLASNQVASQGAHLDASSSGAASGGLIRIGGDFHSTNPGVINAVTTQVNGAGTLRTDGASNWVYDTTTVDALGGTPAMVALGGDVVNFTGTGVAPSPPGPQAPARPSRLPASP